MPSKEKVAVSTGVGDFVFQVPASLSSKCVFDKITKCLGILETWYFGLSCVRADGRRTWLNLDKRFSEQSLIKESPIKLALAFKYYPENINDILQKFTMRLLFIQVKQNIDKEFIYVPPELCVILASYAAQAQYGDFTPAAHPRGTLIVGGVIPPSLFARLNVPRAVVEAEVQTLYKTRRGMSRIEAIHRYLTIAQDLDSYCLRQFPVTNQNGEEVLFTVDHSGIKLFNASMIMVPYTAFTMGEIKRVSFAGKKITISLFSIKDTELLFWAADLTTSRSMFVRTVGYYNLYRRNRSEQMGWKNFVMQEDRRFRVCFAEGSHPMTERDLGLEQQEYHRHVEKVFKVYDHDVEIFRKELTYATGDTKRAKVHALTMERRLANASMKVVKSKQEDFFYDQRSAVFKANIPQIARRHSQMKKHANGYVNQAERFGMETTRAKSVVEGFEVEETKIKSKMADFAVPAHLMMDEGGVGENGEERLATVDLADIQTDFESPWHKRTASWREDPVTNGELEVVRQNLRDLNAKPSWADVLHSKCRSKGPDKFHIVRDLLGEPLEERIRRCEGEVWW